MAFSKKQQLFPYTA